LLIFANFCQFLPIFANFSRFFPRRNRVNHAPPVPGGVEDTNSEKLFPRCGSTFSTQKKFSQKNFLS
jgi:hypothetical protein